MISILKTIVLSKRNRRKLLNDLQAILDDEKNTLVLKHETLIIWELSLVTNQKNAETVISLAKEGQKAHIQMMIQELQRFCK